MASARYIEVRDAIAKDLANNIFRIGDRFPTDQELCERFNVSRSTVRLAIRAFQERGILRRERARGTVVCAPPQQVYAQTIRSLDELGAYASETTFDAVSEEVLTVRGALAEALGCREQSRLLRFSGVRMLQGQAHPLCWTDIYLAEQFIPLRKALRSGPEPFFEQLERLQGVAVERVDLQIRSTTIPEALAPRLGCDALAVGTLVRRRYFDSQGAEPFEVSLSLYPADRYVFTADLWRTQRVEASAS